MVRQALGYWAFRASVLVVVLGACALAGCLGSNGNDPPAPTNLDGATTDLTTTETTGAISGQVSIRGAGAGEGLSVTLGRIDLQGTVTTTTNAAGAFFCGNLPPGIYTVAFAGDTIVPSTSSAEVTAAVIAAHSFIVEPAQATEGG